MYDGIKKIAAIIEKIESNITEEQDYEALAAEMTLSVYEFRRIFAFVVGCPLSEYLRKRRLSLAACELISDTKISLGALSEKYGYSTEAAFSKAFREQHGVSPARVLRGGVEIKLFTRPEFEISISGRSTVNLSVTVDTDFFVKGLTMESPHTDTCCCDAVWSEFYDKGYDAEIKSEKIYATYDSDGGRVICTIGERANDGERKIPACRWACFKMNTTDDDAVNRKYGEILYEILPSAGLTRIDEIPTVEVFPLDMSEDGFEWEIRIPIK